MLHMLRRFTLRKLMLAAFSFVLLIAVIGTGIFSIRLYTTDSRKNIESNMTVVTNQIGRNLDTGFQNAYSSLFLLESNSSYIQLKSTPSGQMSQNQIATYYLTLQKAMSILVSSSSQTIYGMGFNLNSGRNSLQAYQNSMLQLNTDLDQWRESFPEDGYYWIDAGQYRDLIPDGNIRAAFFHLQKSYTGSGLDLSIVAISNDFLTRDLDVSAINQDASLSILTDNSLIASRENDASEKILAEADTVRATTPAGAAASQFLDQYFIVSRQISECPWILVYSVQENRVSNLASLRKDIIVLDATVFLLVLGLVYLISYMLTRSLFSLKKAVQDPDFLSHEIKIESYSEVTALSRAIEKMRQETVNLIEQVKEEQKEKSKLTLNLLQEQIKPHFLYNSIYSCMQLCDSGQSTKASRLLKSLADFYRIGLSRGKTIVTVRSEMEHIKNYLTIMHFRYDGLFDYTIDCPEELLTCCIPRLTLQPVVENAIYHGIKLRHTKGNIYIVGYTQDQETGYIEVHDDGQGFTPQQLQLVQEDLTSVDLQNNRTGYGLLNINARLKLLLGPESGIEITSAPEDTCVRIIFRMSRQEDTR
jgi:two-component system sensor histidine kinase YesM